MKGLEKAIASLNNCSVGSAVRGIDVRMQLPVTIGYIVAVISVPLVDPGRMVWFLCFPIIMAEALHIGYGRVFVNSLWVLPLVAIIGMFNPIFDHEPLWRVGDFVITRGWVTFTGVILRGLLSFQALIILVRSCGFNDMCRAFSRFGMPKVLVTQMLMLYRYIMVMLSEALTMHRARVSRGFGRKSYPLKMWGVFAGQLLIRSVDRARRVNRAMLARGFRGELPCSFSTVRLRAVDWCYLIAWAAVIIALRFCDLSAIFGNMLSS